VVLHGSVLVRASLQMPDGTLELDPSQLPAPG
jgi:hypothetical protein